MQQQQSIRDSMEDNIKLKLKRTSTSDGQKDEKEPPPKLTLYAAWSALFAAFAGVWMYGYALGSINAVYLPLTNAIRRHYEIRYNITLAPATVEALWVVSSTAFPVGGIFGSLLVGPIVRRFGRLNGMLLGHFATTVVSILLGCSDMMRSPEVIIFSRFVIGMSSAAVGLGISIMYVIEVSPRHLRGLFGSMVSVSIGVGILMANVLGLPQVFGNETLWPLLFALTGFPSAVFVLVSRTMAESPRKLFLEDQNEEKAAQVLRRLSGLEDVSATIDELKLEKKQSCSAKQMTVFQVLRSPKLRLATLSAVVIAGGQQMTGLNGVAMNMNNIFLSVGLQYPTVYYISIGISVANVMIQSFTARTTDLFGRKDLLLVGFVIEGISLIILSVSIETQEYSNAMAYVSIGASLGFWAGFSLGPGPLGLVIVAEFFDQTSRSAAITLSTLVLWIIFSVIVVATPYMLASIRGFSFLPYGILAFLIALYIYIYVPETKNRPFSEIQKWFRSEEKEDNSRVEEDQG